MQQRQCVNDHHICCYQLETDADEEKEEEEEEEEEEELRKALKKTQAAL